MTVGRFFGKTSRVLAVAAAILAAVGLTAVPRPADAGGGWGGGGISPGAAAGIGLGAFALGTAITATTHRPRLTIHRPLIIRRGAVGAPITITITLVE